MPIGVAKIAILHNPQERSVNAVRRSANSLKALADSTADAASALVAFKEAYAELPEDVRMAVVEGDGERFGSRTNGGG